MGSTMQKDASRLVQTVKAQISLHIQAVWSGPSLFAYRIIGYYGMYWEQRPRYFVRVQNDLYLHILHVLEDTFSLDVVHVTISL